MGKVIARIVIDTDDWESAFPGVDGDSVMMWKTVETHNAHPFSAHEVSYASALVGDEYFD